MKQLIFVLLISCLACANNQAGQAERKKDMESTKEIYLAGGCFIWRRFMMVRRR